VAPRPRKVRAVEQMRRFAAITDTALAHLSLDALLDELLVRVRHILRADTAALLLVDETGKEVVARAAKGLEEEVERGVRVPLDKGFAGRVAGERKAIMLPDVGRADVVNPLLREKGIVSMLGVPLVFEDRVTGVLHVGTLRRRRFDAEDAQLLQLVADRIALGIEYSRLYEEASRARDETLRQASRLHTLAEASQTFAAEHLELGPLLETVARRTAELVGDVCTIRLLSPDGNTLTVAAFFHRDREAHEALAPLLSASAQPADRGLAASVVATGRPLRIPVADQDEMRQALDPRYWPYLERFPMHSVLIVPLRVRLRITGVLAISRTTPGRPFEAEDEIFLQDLADRAALAIENARLYDDSRNARTEAESANRAKDEFLAVLSHELRTPLTPILAWTRLLRGGLDPRTATRGLEAIERNALGQAQLVDDLLDVSRIVSGKMRIERRPLDPVVVVRAACDSARPSAEARGLTLDATLDAGGALVSADPDRLRQVVANLLSNAIKFTPRGGRIDVILERDESAIEIVVADTGVGIPAAVLPHVFERFRQADSTSTRLHGGLGLGLAIVRHLVELHGGEVQAHSRGVNQGATFRVTLPTEAGAPASAPGMAPISATTPATRLAGRRLLVVEDDRDTREMLCLLLSQVGADVRAADSAQAALEVLGAWSPDVLLADIGMPGENGHALIRAVRSREVGSARALPAVALTAYARPEDRAAALAAGFNVHLAKPVDPDALLALLARLVG
jgi:signal transduction histidine kinase